MSKPRYDWWGYVMGMIRRYPGLAQDYAALHQQSVTPSYSGMPGGGGEGRQLEAVALRTLPGVHQREYEAVTAAIEQTRRLPNGAARLAVIQFVYWDDEHGRGRLRKAAELVGYEYITVCKFHGEFIRLVAFHFGLLDSPEEKNISEGQNDVVK